MEDDLGWVWSLKLHDWGFRESYFLEIRGRGGALQSNRPTLGREVLPCCRRKRHEELKVPLGFLMSQQGPERLDWGPPDSVPLPTSVVSQTPGRGHSLGALGATQRGACLTSYEATFLPRGD